MQYRIQSIEFGRKSTSHGTKTIRARRNISTTQKGVTPLKIVPVETSTTTPLSTKTFRPTGGVINEISVTTTTTMPNQTGLKPRLVTSGKKIGTVSNNIERLSKTQPRRM